MTWAEFEDWIDTNHPFKPEEWAHLAFNIEKSLERGNYKLYINGNIVTYGKFTEILKEPKYTKPGKNRIIFREYDSQKESRKESNTLHVDLKANSMTQIKLSLEEEQLIIKVESKTE